MRLIVATAMLLLPMSIAVSSPAHDVSGLLGDMECDDLSTTLQDFSVDFETEVQPIFTGGCANCHVQSPFPDGGLRLDPGKAYFELVNVASAQNPNIMRVLPGRADLSLLFLKVNCNAPPVGVRMPLERTNLTPQDQARILDWINQGALATPAVPELLFRAEFEARG